MKTTKIIIALFALCLSFLPFSCDLEKIDGPDPFCISDVIASISADKLSCNVPCEVTFTNTTIGATDYKWDFRNGQTSVLQNPSAVTFTDEGTYEVIFIASNSTTGCMDTATVTLEMTDIPGVHANFTVQNDGCGAPCPIQFTNTSTNAQSYAWSFGDNGNSTEPSPEHIYDQKGTYPVRLIAIDAGGRKDTIEKTVTILQLPIADFTFSNGNCVEPCDVIFTETCQFESSYLWEFGINNATSTAPNPTHPYQDNGTYEVSLIATNADGSDTITKSVTIRSENFKAIIDVNGGDLTPLFGVQRTDGKFHILFNQNGYKSVILNPDQTVGNLNSYTFSNWNTGGTGEIISSGDGGFVLAGADGNNDFGKVTKISALQSSLFNIPVSFANDQLASVVSGLTLNTSNEYALIGGVNASELDPGFGRISSNGTLLANVTVPGITGSGAGLSRGYRICQISNGQYVILAAAWLGGAYKIISLNSNGTIDRQVPITNVSFSSRLLSIGSNVYLLNDSAGGAVGIEKFNQVLTSLGSLILGNVYASTIKMVKSSEGHIILCGEKNNQIWLAKYNSTTMSGIPIWERFFGEPVGTMTAASVVALSDGGYLLTGKYTSPTSQERLYLIKTDSEGKVD